MLKVSCTIKSNAELFRYLRLHAPAVIRKIADSSTEIVSRGLFGNLSNDHDPGWLIEFHRRFGSVLQLAVLQKADGIKCQWYRHPIPWEKYLGDPNGSPSLRNGTKQWTPQS